MLFYIVVGHPRQLYWWNIIAGFWLGIAELILSCNKRCSYCAVCHLSGISTHDCMCGVAVTPWCVHTAKCTDWTMLWAAVDRARVFETNIWGISVTFDLGQGTYLFWTSGFPPPSLPPSFPSPSFLPSSLPSPFLPSINMWMRLAVVKIKNTKCKVFLAAFGT